jgi:DNA-binding beta-propeller fold protein YncE
MRLTRLVLALGILSSGSSAQTGNAIVDSANVARAAYRRAAAALQSNNLPTARTEIDRAAVAWPTQEAYAWGRVAVAARMGDTSGVVWALNAYAALGLGRDLRREASLAGFVSSPALANALAAHEANRAPLARSTVRATLPDSTFWPEGMDFDPSTGSFYVTSLRHRTIAEVRRDGSVREVMPRGLKGVGAIFGVRVDAKNGVLWATTSGTPQMEGFVPGDTATAALLRIRLRNGVIDGRWDIPVAPGGHVLGDLAIGPNGDVYVTDSQHPTLYVLASGADTLTTITNPLFRSLQGIAPAPDGRAIYVADYSHGILRVELGTKQVTRVADAPGSVSLGCDGLAWHRGTLIAVQNGVAPARVMRFTLSGDGLRFTNAEVLDRNSLVADEPTIGAIAGDAFVYVANSQWEKHDANGAPRPGVARGRPVLLSVPLPR